MIDTVVGVPSGDDAKAYVEAADKGYELLKKSSEI
jgi:hypothetical protein